MDVPSQTHCPCTDVMFVGSENRRTINTITEVKQITVVVCIVSNGVCTDRTGTAFIISRISSFGITISIRRKRIITHRETFSRITMSLCIHLRDVTTGCKIEQMNIFEQFTKCNGQFSFVFIALAFTITITTTFGKLNISITTIQWRSKSFRVTVGVSNAEADTNF